MTMPKPWWSEKADFREKKAVVKIYDNDQFLSSCHIPSVYLPLTNPYEVFTYQNTCCFEDDPAMVALFDSLHYKIGHCYQNTTRTAELFRKAGFDVKTYAGWVFIDEQLPIHHCWAVVRNANGQQAVLDLSCDYIRMTQWLQEKEKETDSPHSEQDITQRLVEWTAYAADHLTHTQRCFPCGVLPPTYLYIGAECDPNAGRSVYQKLIQDFPDHFCQKKVNAKGYNKTQWSLKQNGFME